MADLHSVVLPKAASALMALGETQIYRVPHEAIREVGDMHPALERAFWRDCTVDGAILSQWSMTNSRLQGDGRIAHLLAEMSVRVGVSSADDQMHYPFPLTQQQIGEATNMTPVHVNRMLRGLRDKGLVEIRARRVHIMDWRGLCAVGEFDPIYLHLRGAE
ncbi:Crp/Fnr family transcriptional regulator [Sphingomonas sp. 3P27F8]|uniref:Crp/Fnr family transcriptional regulator n=1 Tax=Sphingomonas sp. 3P27F8 TaxID=2502213 RepID=UPI0014855EE7|nr:Crp/Fnr family transcriptional regulator [Sphingomonas sp. 3P27F8]